MDRIIRDLLFKMTDDAGDTSVFVASTSAADLTGDTIDARGWDLSRVSRGICAFMANHNSRDIIGSLLGKVVSAETNGDALVCKVQWAADQPPAVAARNLVKQGMASAVSVGFWPLEYAARYDEKDRFVGYSFTKQTLLELSLVMVPANADALVVQRSLERGFLERVLPAPANPAAAPLLHRSVELARRKLALSRACGGRSIARTGL